MPETTTDTALARRESIADGLRRSARRDPDRVALRFGERSWTYAALDAAANRVARRLVGAGLEPGQRVAAYGRNSDAYLVTWLACLRAGLVHVPVNYALQPGELGYIVRQSGASALVCDAGAGRRTSRPARTARGRGTRALRRAPAAFDVLATALDEAADATPLDARYAHPVAQILYTSGTTAEPKGAVMTHAALLAHYASCIASAELAHDDRSLDALPLYHSAQMHVFLMPHLLLGAASILIEAPEPATVLRLIEEHRITVVLRAADGLDQPAAPRRLRPPRPEQPAQGLLRRLDHAGAGAEELRRRLPSAGAVEPLRPERDRPAGDRAAARGARRAAGARPAGRSSTSRRGSSTRRCATCRPACTARSSTARRSCSPSTGTSPRRRRRRSPAAGSTRATSAGATRRAISTSSTGSRT